MSISTLKPGSIHDWEHMVSNFNTKFFYAKAKYILAKLGGARQYPSEDLDLMQNDSTRMHSLLRSNRQRSLLNVCLHGMANKITILSEKPLFSFLFQVDRSINMNKWVRKEDSKAKFYELWQFRDETISEKMVDSCNGWKWSGIETLESEKNFLQDRLQPIVQVGMKDVACLGTLFLWHEEIHYFARANGERFSHTSCHFVKQMPSQVNKKYAKYWPCHRRKGYVFKQCMTFKRILDEKLQTERLYARMRELTTSTCDLFLIIGMIKARTSDDGVFLKESYRKRCPLQPKGEPDLDKIAEWI